MKVLILSSGNRGVMSPFVNEQAIAIQMKGIEVSNFMVQGKGYKGYLSNLSKLNYKISLFKPDLLHAHYGLTALLANLQRKVPVISTFHGSDIWVYKKNRILSQVAHLLSAHSIVVDPRMVGKLVFPEKTTVIPCGVDLEIFKPIIDQTIFEKVDLPNNKVNILFSSKFEYFEKNYPLAKKVIDILGEGFNLVELRGYSRMQVSYLLNVCNIALMTSISEASPQFIKEAMSCNCPIVSTNVGDVFELISKTEGCFVSSFDPYDIANKVKLALDYRKYNKFTKGRDRIVELGLSSREIAGRVIDVYHNVLKKQDQRFFAHDSL